MQKGSHGTPDGRMKKGKDYEAKVRAVYEGAGFSVLSRGMPDLVCVRNNGGAHEIVFVECKTGRSHVLKQQRRAMTLLEQAGFKTVVQHEDDAIKVPKPRETREYCPLTGSSFRLTPLSRR